MRQLHPTHVKAAARRLVFGREERREAFGPRTHLRGGRQAGAGQNVTAHLTPAPTALSQRDNAIIQPHRQKWTSSSELWVTRHERRMDSVLRVQPAESYFESTRVRSSCSSSRYEKALVLKNRWLKESLMKAYEPEDKRHPISTARARQAAGGNVSKMTPVDQGT